MIVTYRERRFLDKYRCIDTERKFKAISFFKPAGTSLYYFKVNEFNNRTVSEDDLISIEE